MDVYVECLNVVELDQLICSCVYACFSLKGQTSTKRIILCTKNFSFHKDLFTSERFKLVLENPLDFINGLLISYSLLVVR